MMAYQKGIALALKYIAATLMAVAMFCVVHLWTPVAVQESHTLFYSRNVAEDGNNQWMDDPEDAEKFILEDEPGDCGILKAPADRFVVFNVLPKSGSRTLNSLALNVATQHGVDVQNTMALTNETKLERIERLLMGPTPTFVYSHLPFVEINSTERNIVYISIVRDPIDRLVSLYYYKRYGDSTEPGYFRDKMDQLNLSKDTFDECVERNGDCISSTLMQKTFRHFCGDDKRITTNGHCLSIAKKNVRNRYLVVGAMDDYIGFIKVLERLLPDVFQGGEQFYKDFVTKTYFEVMKTKNKTGPSEKVKRLLRKKMALDYEFYDYVKKEFDILKNKLGISSEKTR